jgi:hypothetical protein
MIEKTIKAIPNWIRWALLVFTPFLVFLLFNVVGNITLKIYFFFFADSRHFEKFFSVVVIQGTAAYYSVIVTGYVAPRANKFFAVSISMLVFLFSGFCITLFAILGQWGNILTIIPVAAGAAIGGSEFCPEFYLSSRHEEEATLQPQEHSGDHHE